MHIKKLIITACLLSMSLTGFSAAASVSILDHPTVAVPEFKNTGLISAEWENERDALNQAADIATDDLVNSGRFDDSRTDWSSDGGTVFIDWQY